MINTNLRLISHRFQIIADYLSNVRFQLSLTHSFMWTPKLTTTKFGSQETKSIALSCGQNVFRCLEPFRRGPRVWQTNRRTDRQTERTVVSNSPVYGRALKSIDDAAAARGVTVPSAFYQTSEAICVVFRLPAELQTPKRPSSASVAPLAHLASVNLICTRIASLTRLQDSQSDKSLSICCCLNYFTAKSGGLNRCACCLHHRECGKRSNGVRKVVFLHEQVIETYKVSQYVDMSKVLFRRRRYSVFGLSVRPCVHALSYTKSLLTRYLINRVWTFHTNFTV